MCFKGYFGGQLLSILGQDANNHTFGISYAILDVENKDHWKIKIIGIFSHIVRRGLG